MSDATTIPEIRKEAWREGYLARNGIGTIWIVWRDEHPPDGGKPEFLAAYDGIHAEEQAFALVQLIKRCCPSGQVVASPVQLWPLVKAGPFRGATE